MIMRAVEIESWVFRQRSLWWKAVVRPKLPGQNHEWELEVPSVMWNFFVWGLAQDTQRSSYWWTT